MCVTDCLTAKDEEKNWAGRKVLYVQTLICT